MRGDGGDGDQYRVVNFLVWSQYDGATEALSMHCLFSVFGDVICSYNFLHFFISSFSVLRGPFFINAPAPSRGLGIPHCDSYYIYLIYHHKFICNLSNKL